MAFFELSHSLFASESALQSSGLSFKITSDLFFIFGLIVRQNESRVLVNAHYPSEVLLTSFDHFEYISSLNCVSGGLDELESEYCHA